MMCTALLLIIKLLWLSRIHTAFYFTPLPAALTSCYLITTISIRPSYSTTAKWSVIQNGSPSPPAKHNHPTHSDSSSNPCPPPNLAIHNPKSKRCTQTHSYHGQAHLRPPQSHTDLAPPTTTSSTTNHQNRRLHPHNGPLQHHPARLSLTTRASYQDRASSAGRARQYRKRTREREHHRPSRLKSHGEQKLRHVRLTS